MSRLFWKNLFLSITTLFGSVLVATVAMIAVYSFSSKSIPLHVANSLSSYVIEGEHYRYAPFYISSQMDNYTDALMLSEALFSSQHTREIIKDSMSNPYYGHKNHARPLVQLIAFFNEKDPSQIFRIDYPRFWHGYLVFLKPLLTIFTLSDIRVLNMTLGLLLVCLLMIQLYSIGKYKLSIPFLAGLLTLNPISCAMSMQYATLYLTVLLTCLILLKYKLYSSSKYWYFFFLIGICTAFLNFLTFPLVSLGIPLILFVLLNNEELLPKIKKVISSSISWGVGFFGMWFGKWCVGSLITGNNIFLDAYEQTKLRMGNKLPWDEKFEVTFGRCLLRAFDVFYNNVTVLFFIVFILGVIAYLLLKIYKIGFKKSILLPLLLIGSYPFVWCFIIREHTLEHTWFTYRIFSVAVLAFVYAVVYSIDKNNPSKNK